MRKSTWRIIAIVLVAVVALGAVSLGTGLLKVDDDKAYDQFGKKPNEDNIYTVECMTLEDTNDGNGIIVDVDERTGAVTLDGKASMDMDYTVGTVDLEAGTYTLTACNKASMTAVYVSLEDSSGNELGKFDFTGNTIELAADYTNVDIVIYIKDEAELNNVKILPVIVPGDEAADFYK